MPGSTLFHSLSLSSSFSSFHAVRFLCSANGARLEAAPFFLPFRPSKHDTTPLGDPPMPKDRLTQHPRSDRTAIVFTLLARLFPYFLCLATSLANRRSILASMRRSRAPTSFPMVHFFHAKDTYTELYPRFQLLYWFSCFALIQEKNCLSLSLSLFFTFLSSFTAKITFIKYRAESWNCPV